MVADIALYSMEGRPTGQLPGTVLSVNTRLPNGLGAVTVLKDDLGLGNVDNTSDAGKPVSTAQATAIGLKQDTLVSGTNIKTINSTSILGSGDLAVVASGIAVTPVGGISATDAQAALAELDAEKQALIGTISGIAKGNGANALTAATAGTDYSAPGTAESVTTDRTFSANITETPVVANTGTAYTVTERTMHDLTLTGNVTFTFPALASGKQFTLWLKPDGTGSRTITWPSTVRWGGGTAPTITSTAAKTDLIGFICDGTYWLGFVGGQNFTRA